MVGMDDTMERKTAAELRTEFARDAAHEVTQEIREGQMLSVKGKLNSEVLYGHGRKACRGGCGFKQDVRNAYFDEKKHRDTKLPKLLDEIDKLFDKLVGHLHEEDLVRARSDLRERLVELFHRQVDQRDEFKPA